MFHPLFPELSPIPGPHPGKSGPFASLLWKMGRSTGFEPATPRITILCSNQLSYDRRKIGSANILTGPPAVNNFPRPVVS